MKEMKLPYGITVEQFDEPILHITNELLDSLFIPINNNKIKIFDSIATTERLLDKIISEYFYGAFEIGDKIYRDRFNSLILSSDWCSFSAKRKLMIFIINDSKILEGKEKTKYDKLLGDAMAYRNALTHGELSTDGRIVKLKYYQGSPRVIILNEEYFQNVENCLYKCYSMTERIAVMKDIIKL